MQTQIALRYSGPAVESGQMDVYEATANMVAFSDFVIAIAKIQYGEEIEAKAQVAGFEHGSFVAKLVFDVAGVTAAVFAATSPHELLQTVRDSFGLWKFLHGKPPKSVQHAPNSINVENNDGQIIQVNASSVHVVFSEKTTEAVTRFVREALEKPGMDKVELLAEAGKSLAAVSQTEGQYFVNVAPTETITDTTVKLALIIEAPVFKEDNKWRFSDGQQSFFADIQDKVFLSRVNSGERFGKGDLLLADVKISQQQTGMKLSAERTIMHVYEHKVASRQLRLDE